MCNVFLRVANRFTPLLDSSSVELTTRCYTLAHNNKCYSDEKHRVKKHNEKQCKFKLKHLRILPANTLTAEKQRGHIHWKGWLPPADTPQTSPTSSPLSPDIQVDDVAAPRRVDHRSVRLPSLGGLRIHNKNAIASNKMFNPF